MMSDEEAPLRRRMYIRLIPTRNLIEMTSGILEFSAHFRPSV
jgi:hypothetical protein